jgi:hypothetical protein
MLEVAIATLGLRTDTAFTNGFPADVAEQINGGITFLKGRMTNDAPAAATCPHCKQPMRHVRTVPRFGGLCELFVFHCAPCNHAETQEWERSDYLSKPRT